MGRGVEITDAELRLGASPLARENTAAGRLVRLADSIA
jgi:hypothetical protein